MRQETNITDGNHAAPMSIEIVMIKFTPRVFTIHSNFTIKRPEFNHQTLLVYIKKRVSVNIQNIFTTF